MSDGAPPKQASALDADRVGHPAAAPFSNKAFLSYNQRADRVLATELERALEQFAKKWYHRRAFDVFRDTSSLAANPGLWSALEATLDDSEFYVLLACPESAASPWVGKELAHWLGRRDRRRRVLLVLTGGAIRWDEAAGDFDWAATTALARAGLSKVFDQEPLWVDCAWASGLEPAALRRDAHFADYVATLASALHGRSKSELFGEDLRQHRRQMRLARGAVATLIVLLLFAVGFGLQSHWRGNDPEQSRNDLKISFGKEQEARKDAESKARTATSRLLAARSASERNKRLDRALLLAVEALRTANTFEARDSLFKALHERSRLRTFLHIEDRFVRCVGFSPDGTTLAVASERPGRGTCRVSLRDVGRRAVLPGGPLAVKEGSVNHVAFSPDGKTLAAGFGDGTSGSQGGVVLWDTATRKRLTADPLVFKEGYVNGVAFSADGKTLAFSYNAGFYGRHSGVVLWDTATRKRLSDGPLAVTEGYVRRLAFSPNGKALATGYEGAVGGGRGGAILWDVTTHDRLWADPLFVEEGRVSGVAFHPDGKTIATGYLGGGIGGGAVLWDTELESWQRRAGQIANRNLTPEEWYDYFRDTPYRATFPDLPVPQEAPGG
jgi:hypothetical protein